MLEQRGNFWVIVEPRSNTMRTRMHQQRLPHCFDAADVVIFAAPSDRNLPADEVLDAVEVCRQIGTHASMISDVDSIVADVVEKSKPGDHLLVLSNGGFEAIHTKLLKALA